MIFKRLNLRFQFSLIIISILVACSSGCERFFGNTSINATSDPSESTVIQAEILFKVKALPQLSENSRVVLDIVDEVTGLALNPSRYLMENKGDHFELRVPINVGSVIKYRYLRQGTPPAVEYTAAGRQIRYRLFSVTGANEINDQIAAWNDSPYTGKIGRVTGKISGDLKPGDLSNIMVDIGGAYTYSSSDGSFILDRIPVGTHMMVLHSLDGRFLPFQQEVKIADQAETHADISVSPSKLVNVTFLVNVPENTPENASVQFVGNIYSLGNTFADLGGGVSTLASRAPHLQNQGDKKYTISLQLPAGLDLRYKYSLGDGFWNAEHQSDGQFLTRQFIVPQSDAIVQDTVDTWQMGEKAPVQFNLTINAKKFPNERPAIQFNPYGWLEPLPMWAGDSENNWSFTLFGPLDILNQVGYRYCRNEQCDIAYNADRSNGEPQNTFSIDNVPTGGFNDAIDNWALTTKLDTPTPVLKTQINPRGSSFITGVQLEAGYHPSWQPHLNSAFYYIHGMGANHVILMPEWTFTAINLPVLEPVPGQNALYADMANSAKMAAEQGLKVVLFPQPTFSTDAEEFWTIGTKDSGWWQSWFDRYEKFIIHNAILAKEINASAFVVGGNAILPALPNGILADGTSSLSPENAEQRWLKIIKEVRSIYPGQLLWAIPYPAGMGIAPNFIKDVDGMYIQWSANLNIEEPTQINIAKKFEELLDQDIHPLYEKTGKPIWIGIEYAANSEAAQGCQQIFGCSYTHQSSSDLLVQSDLYNAAFYAISQREWITGFISEGFYPPVALIDQSPTIFQKPAADTAWYWFNALIGQATP